MDELDKIDYIEGISERMRLIIWMMDYVYDMYDSDKMTGWMI